MSPPEIVVLGFIVIVIAWAFFLVLRLIWRGVLEITREERRRRRHKRGEW